MKLAPEGITGANLVEARFGGWPSFHDAEILHLSLDRDGEAACVTLRVYAFTTLPETDDRGYFKIVNDSTITFRFRGAHNIELEGFNHQNVINDLTIEPEGSGMRVTLHPCFGLDGHFLCTTAEVIGVDAIDGD